MILTATYKEQMQHSLNIAQQDVAWEKYKFNADKSYIIAMNSS